MSRELFTSIVEEVTNHCAYFYNNIDCTGRKDISTLMKCTSTVHQLSYDTVLDDLDGYLQMGSTTSHKSVDYFCNDDYKRIRYKRMHEATRKDEERSFGVLKKKWAILANPARPMQDEDVLNDDDEESEGDIHENFQEQQDWKNGEEKIEPNNIGERKWANSDEVFYMINIYGPHEIATKSSLWSRILDFIRTHEGHFIIFGDINEVRDESERYGTLFSKVEAQTIISCIDDTGFIDLPLGGRSYTWMNKADTKMSKLYHFLVSNFVMDAFPDLKVTTLAHGWCGHIPLMLHSEKVDYEPVPFKIFHSWMQRDGFEEVIKIAYEDCSKGFFYLASGLKINIAKSNVYGIGVSSENIVEWLVLHSALQFCGKLSSWKANLLSVCGRLTLIKAVLGNIGICYMSIFKCPESVLKTIESIRASFFWGGSGDRKKMA
ncbi:RNA-directed DNA polymerase, eukaryota, reverse transcriptase zinc-binding domain protein [Tanacetum coccineum]|uniref:RNA-directed DNA polymerase, eukaryota, reverse transcriptase zinc-binding domain protein n=1 Tax=Tanacetum coccineum TaxID=301880 RepID=A0ABQ5GJX9_9ASTR